MNRLHTTRPGRTRVADRERMESPVGNGGRAAIATSNESIGAIIAKLAAVQKSSRGAPAYARWFNRPTGRVLAAIAFKAGFTPNMVTAASAVLTAGGLVAIAVLHPGVWTGIGIAGALVLGYALDSADGQLARLRGGGSPAGEWLDHVVDCVKTATIHLCVLVCWYRFFHLASGLLLVPLIFAVESSVFFFTIILTEQLRRSASSVTSSTMPDTTQAAPIARSLLVLPADYGVLAVSFALLGNHTPFVWVYTFLAAANCLFFVGAMPRWYKDMLAISS